MALSESVRKQLSQLVTENRVVLFMKGTRHNPQCGFSAQVVQILDGLVPSYETVDVLRAPEIREGIKEFSEWPTIPQLYVDGKFVGGCDIVKDMSSSGELQNVLGGQVVAARVPTVTMSESAVKAFEAALADAGGDCLRFSVGPNWQHELFVGPREPGDVEVCVSGLTLLVDKSSSRRVDGASIDYVRGQRGGFKIDNPNAPPSVKQISAPELKAMLDRGEVVLFDVRPESERAVALIREARSLDAAGEAYLRGLDRGTAIALHCHHGMRSQAAAEQLLHEEFRKVYNLKGGIDAWSQTVDPSVPRY